MTKCAWLCVLAILVLSGCFSKLPAIDDPNELVKECQPFCVAGASGGVDPSQWPPAVKKLNPVRVRQDQGCLLITTYEQTGSGVRGYIVAEKEPPPMSHYEISPEGSSEIYCFDFQP